MANKKRPPQAAELSSRGASARVGLTDSARVALRDSARVGLRDSAAISVRDSAAISVRDSAAIGVRDSARIGIFDPSSRVTVSAALPLSQMHSAVLRMLGLTDSVALTIRGDARQIASAVIALSERVSVNSARLSLSGSPASSPQTSIRGNKPA